METIDNAHWENDELVHTAFYDWPQAHSETFRMRKCDPCSEVCSYWVASDGEAFGIQVTEGSTAIVTVENALSLAGATSVYVTWRMKNATPSKFNTWSKKWTKRTLAPEMFDSPVRCFA